MDERPIGVFDSGVGGLTVIRELKAILPSEDIIYFGDTARVPYGNKSIPAIRRFSHEVAKFLEEMRVKMIVVACNTASALALDFLRRQTLLPIIGVIEPGVRAAIRGTQSSRIGVIGTPATIRSEAYQTRLKSLRKNCEVFAKACPLFVPLVEENLVGHPITKLAIEMYLKELQILDLTCLILACTHYPLLKSQIVEFLGKGVNLIDSAHETAKEVAEVISAMHLEGSQDRMGTEEFYVSDSPETFIKIGETFLGRKLDRVFLEPVWKRDITSA